MKLERILRSPLINFMLFVLLAPTLLMLLDHDNASHGLRYAIAFAMLGFIAAWIVLVLIFNRKHPERKIRLITYIPMEFREEDEGQQWMNYRVTRRVYMLYSAGIPITIVLIFLWPDGKAAGVVCLSLLGALQQLLYWWELRKWERS